MTPERRVAHNMREAVARNGDPEAQHEYVVRAALAACSDQPTWMLTLIAKVMDAHQFRYGDARLANRGALVAGTRDALARHGSGAATKTAVLIDALASSLVGRA